MQKYVVIIRVGDERYFVDNIYDSYKKAIYRARTLRRYGLDVLVAEVVKEYTSQ